MSFDSKPKTGDEKMVGNVSRRKFISGSVASLAALTCGAVAYPKIDFIKNLIFGNEIYEQDGVRKVLDFVAAIHNIEVVVGDSSDILSFGDNPDQELVVASLRTLVVELSRYPANYFRDADKVHKIHLVDNAMLGITYFLSHPVGGLAGFDKTMLINVHGATEDSSLLSYRLHHEIYHLYDMDGSSKMRDRKWFALHQSCNCGRYLDGSFYKDVNKKLLYPQYFVSAYGQASPEEERAELGSVMLHPERHKAFLERINTEKNKDATRILLEKYRLLKEDYLSWSNGDMDDVYWSNLLE